jgi:hypothetical protein
MRVYVQTLVGVHRNTQGQLAATGFSRLGVEVVEFLDDEDLEDLTDEDLLIAGNSYTSRRIREVGGTPYTSAYPEELDGFYGKNLRRCDVSEIEQEDLPLFLRPADGTSFEPVIVFDERDMKASGVTGAVLATEVVFYQSTWRLFVRYGKALALLPAEGDPGIVPDRDFVDRALAAWSTAPKGAALDFGIDAEGNTQLLRARDAYVIPPLGLDARSYARLLCARWAEIAGTVDPLAER